MRRRVEPAAAAVVTLLAGGGDSSYADQAKEAVKDLARANQWGEARALYEWFLPLLRLDTLPKFVQLIKLAQVAVGQGSARVRPPRLEVTGAEYDGVVALIRDRLAARPGILAGQGEALAR